MKARQALQVYARLGLGRDLYDEELAAAARIRLRRSGVKSTDTARLERVNFGWSTQPEDVVQSLQLSGNFKIEAFVSRTINK